jgi:hypothetical protein
LRAGVVALIGVLVYFGVKAIEEWPLTGWRLYSNIKGPTSGSYFPYRVAPDGGEHAIDFERLPDAYSRAPGLLEKLDRRTESQREEMCVALAAMEREAGRPVTEIKFYWERYRVRLVEGERRKNRFERELTWTCAEDIVAR